MSDKEERSSGSDRVDDALERLEWQDAKREPTPESKLRAVTRRTALAGGAAGLATVALQACGGGGTSSSTAASGGSDAAAIFKPSKSYKFTFVNHVTTNPFFVPTKYGAADACKSARLLLSVDRLADQQRHRDGQRVQQRDQRRSRRHRGLAGRPARRSTLRFSPPSARASRSSPTTPTQPATRAWPTSVRTCSSPARRWASTSLDLVPAGRRRAVHRDAGRAQHPAADRRREGHDREQARRSDTIATGAASRRALDDRSYAQSALEHRRECSRSTPAARRALPRRSRSTV